MKYIQYCTKKFLPFLISGTILSCSGTNIQEESISANDITNETTMVDSAKQLLIVINEYVKKGIIGEMQTSTVNDSINPLLEKYKLIYKSLTPNDTMAVTEFRIQKINELIDLQIQYPNSRLQPRTKEEIKDSIAHERKIILLKPIMKKYDCLENEARAIQEQKVIIGMTKKMCIAAWGQPVTKNRTTTSNSVSEQWVYGDNSYLYFEDDILDAIQN